MTPGSGGTPGPSVSIPTHRCAFGLSNCILLEHLPSARYCACAHVLVSERVGVQMSVWVCKHM